MVPVLFRRVNVLANICYCLLRHPTLKVYHVYILYNILIVTRGGEIHKIIRMHEVVSITEHEDAHYMPSTI